MPARDRDLTPASLKTMAHTAGLTVRSYVPDVLSYATSHSFITRCPGGLVCMLN